MQDKNIISGGCACGEVRFRFSKPVARRVVCHCRACQFTAGGGPAYVAVVPREHFRVTRGHPREYLTLSDAGNHVTRYFCGNCGTHVYAVSDGTPETCSLKVGCLDEPGRFRPRTRLWTGEAQRWHKRHWLTRGFKGNSPVRSADTTPAERPEQPEQT